MNAELEAIKAAWESKPKGERESETTALADTYVEAHPEEFTAYTDMDLPECVTALGVFRQAGMDEAVWRVQVWLWHRFEPQHIGGPVRARIRMPGVR